MNPSRARPIPASSSPTPAADSALVLNLAAALLAAALLRFFRLGAQNLWIDEVFTWRSADIGSPLGWPRLVENMHGPLLSVILHTWCGWVGESEWALRLPSAVFGVALVPVVAWLGARWVGRETVIPAAWLAACSPFLVWYSQEARNYSLLMLCACLSLLALLRLRERFSTGRLAGFLAATAAGLLSNFSFALIAPLQLKWWFTRPVSARRRLAEAGLAAAILVLVMTPWLVQATRVLDWSRLRPAREARADEPPLRGPNTFHLAGVPFAAHAFSVGYTLGPSLRELRADPSLRPVARHAGELAVTALVFGALVALGLRALARRRRLGDGLLWLLAPALLVSYMALHNFKVFHPRYLAVAAPGFILLLAAAFADLRPRGRWVAGLAVGALWSVSLVQHYVSPRYAREDYRTVAARIVAEARPGELILAANTADLMFYYYRGSLPVRSFWLGFAADSARLEDKLDEAMSGTRGVWGVMSRPEALDPRGAFVRAMARRHPGATAHARQGVTWWHVTESDLKPASGVRRGP